MNESNGGIFRSGEAFRSYVKQRQAKEGKLPTKEKAVVTGYENILTELDLKKQELQKEKIKVQTEKLGLNQALREEARYELTIERLIDAIKTVEIPKVPDIIQNRES